MLPVTGEQPRYGTAYFQHAGIDADRIESCQHRPGSVDVIGAPPTEPAAVTLLLALQEGERRGDGMMVLFVTELCQKAETAGRDVCGRRIEQRAVVCERNAVEEVMRIVGIEGGPAAVPARRAGSFHVRGVSRVSGSLEREIGVDRGAKVEFTTEEERPPAIGALGLAKIGSEAALLAGLDGAEIVLQQDEGGRHRGVGFQFE
jgi:hypothetical protein